MNDPLSARFEALLEPGSPDWLDVRRRTRRRPRRLAFLAAAATLVVAVPAVAIAVDPGVLPWNDQQPAPTSVVQNFSSFGIGAPPGMNPHVQAGQARGIPLPNGGTVWVAPAAGNGLCIIFPGNGGCIGGARNTIGLTTGIDGAFKYGTPIDTLPITVDGPINAAPGSTLEADLADGTTIPIPIVWVGPPINAGFYRQTIPPGPKITALVLRDHNGTVIATNTGPARVYDVSGPDGPAGASINPATGAPNAADASQTHVLITSGGATLSTAPRTDGNGYCVWTQIGQNGGGGSDCHLPLPSPPELGLGLFDNSSVLDGQVGSDVASVTLEFADGTTKTLTPTLGWVLLADLPTAATPITITAYNSGGDEVATQTLGD